MLTFRKLALVAAAGFAALSISCSDSNDDVAPGEIKGLNLKKNTDYYTLEGTIEAFDANVVDSISWELTNLSSSLDPAKGMKIPSAINLINLSSYSSVIVLAPVCKTSGNLSVKIVLTAHIGGGTTSQEATDTFACLGSADTDLVKKTLVVGGSGSEGSFADLDPATPVAYKQSEYLSKIGDIDIVYGQAFGGGDYIYSTFGAIMEELNVDFENTEMTFLWELTGNTASAVRSATTASDLPEALFDLNMEATDDKISAASNATFAVFTSEGNFRYAYISTKNGTTSVTITNIYNPFED
jgi:hypothetical protein